MNGQERGGFQREPCFTRATSRMVCLHLTQLELPDYLGALAQ